MKQQAKFPLLIFLLLTVITSYGQQESEAQQVDRLIKKDGSAIAGKVIEITPTDVKYKKASNLGGPTYSIPKRNLARIEYASGDKEDMMVDLIYKKGGTVLDVKILEVTDSQIKYTLMEDPDGQPLTIAKTEVEEIEYATGEKINLLPDAIITRDGKNTLEVKVVDVTYGEIKYKLYNDPSGATKSISKSNVYSVVYADGKTVDYGDWIPFGADTFLKYSSDGKIITDLKIDGQKYICHWSSDLDLTRQFVFTNSKKYNWQMVAEDGSYIFQTSLYNSNGDLIKKLMLTYPKQGWEWDLDRFGSADGMISPNGHRIFYVSEDPPGATISLFDGSGKFLNKTGIRYATGMRFSSNGKFCLFAQANKIHVIDSDGNEVSEFKWPYKYSDSFDFNEVETNFSFDGNFIATKYEEDEIAIWDIKGNLIKKFPHQAASLSAFSRDGKKIVTAGNLPYGKVFMRKSETGERFIVSPTGESPNKSVKGVMSDGIKIWSIDGTLIKGIPFPAVPTSVEFTPDGKGLAIVVAGTPLWLWEDEDYKLPEGVLNELIQIAKDKAREEKERRAERRLNMLFAIGEGVAAGVENNKREMAVFNARMQSRVDQANREVAAIEEANRPVAPAPSASAPPQRSSQPAATPPKKEVKCKYAVYYSIPRQQSPIVGSGESVPSPTFVLVSNIYTTMEQRGEYKTDTGKRFVFDDEENAIEKHEDLIDDFSDTSKWKVSPTPKVENKCR